MDYFERFINFLAISIKGMDLTAIALISYLAFLIFGIQNRNFREKFLKSLLVFNKSLVRAIGLAIGFDDVNLRSKQNQIELNDDIVKILSEIKKGSAQAPNVQISEKLEQEISKNIASSIDEHLNPIFHGSIAHLISTHAQDLSKNRAIDITLDTISQIRSASTTVAVRGFFNLAFGIVFAATALYFLKQSIEMLTISQIRDLSLSQAVYFVAMRFSLAIIMTLVSYFFLSLYRRSLEDVKYYQNEVTFLSGKIAALSLALSTGDKSTIGSVIPFLMDTDRNKSMRLSSVDESSHALISKIIEKIPNISVGK
jgi:hypothetical protein